MLDPLVYQELGEPLLVRPGDVFGFYRDVAITTKGFFCVNLKNGKAFLRYVYVHSGERGNGIFSKLMTEVERFCKEAKANEITAVSTNVALPLYLKKGYSVKKSHVNYHNIQKQL